VRDVIALPFVLLLVTLRVFRYRLGDLISIPDLKCAVLSATDDVFALSSDGAKLVAVLFELALSFGDEVFFFILGPYLVELDSYSGEAILFGEANVDDDVGAALAFPDRILWNWFSIFIMLSTAIDIEDGYVMMGINGSCH
jgi:hypothetical protein